MNIREWYKKRGFRFVIQRASQLVGRYSLTPAKAMTRINKCLTTLIKLGCFPTFFVPGIVVKRYPRFFQDLQLKGVEIAVHSFQHVDLISMKVEDAREQLIKAVEAFNENGVEVHGFRCPYLSYSDELLASLPAELFNYSSNKAIWLDVFQKNQSQGQSLILETLYRFYHPQSSSEKVSMPWAYSNKIENPVCVPDDLQLHDGLHLDPDGISKAWIDMLHLTHKRGELFNLIFHPELGSVCNRPFDDLIHEALRLEPAVWITRLRDISEWWREKSNFSVQVTVTSIGLKLKFICSPHATILLQSPHYINHALEWDGKYHRLISNYVELPLEPRPFVGLAAELPDHVAPFLKEQGYIVDTGAEAINCGIYIDAAVFSHLTDEVKLINYIETLNGALVRYWRWPNGARSAMCITGDLDALTLIDYVSRLFTR